MGDYIGATMGDIKGDTRSLGYSSYVKGLGEGVQISIGGAG